MKNNIYLARNFGFPISKIKLSPTTNQITNPREVEIARLVAEGFTNAEIGENLWITTQ